MRTVAIAGRNSPPWIILRESQGRWPFPAKHIPAFKTFVSPVAAFQPLYCSYCRHKDDIWCDCSVQMGPCVFLLWQNLRSENDPHSSCMEQCFQQVPDSGGNEPAASWGFVKRTKCPEGPFMMQGLNIDNIFKWCCFGGNQVGFNHVWSCRPILLGF